MGEMWADYAAGVTCSQVPCAAVCTIPICLGTTGGAPAASENLWMREMWAE